ncbi:MAG TPA: hypothetical protein VKZ54_07730 [Membranihabitans sp.]|nr:hypothetical protein [Membranihabitans sp.]
MSDTHLEISLDGRSIKGPIYLDGSKSISNRALIIQALTEDPKPIHHLSTSDDTQALQRILNSEGDVYDTGAAGTTFRFLTAFLAVSGKSCTLTGSERMKQRPIGELVSALRTLGANISYLEKEGYPPLRFEPSTLSGRNELRIASHISSQFISALLLIAPTLPQGLTLHLEGDMVSRSYIELTLQIMKTYGINYQWNGNLITIAPQPYQAQEFKVESDWSAASYYYGIAALVDDAELQLWGLSPGSFQGDAIVADLYEAFGVHTTYQDGRITLKKSGSHVPEVFEHNFILCPDIAQTMAVTCGALGTRGIFSGLQTLSIKETDRIGALRTELGKLGVKFEKMEIDQASSNTGESHVVSGQARFPDEISFSTYEDHRMAMAFAPLAVLHPVRIEEPEVVSKSYPDFWVDLERLGFIIRR